MGKNADFNSKLISRVIVESGINFILLKSTESLSLWMTWCRASLPLLSLLKPTSDHQLTIIDSAVANSVRKLFSNKVARHPFTLRNKSDSF